MNVAVLGGGSGAHATALDLARRGHAITLCNTPEREESILIPKVRGGIEGVRRSGGPSVIEGFFKLSLVTTDIRLTLETNDIILIVVPAFGQRAFMEAMLPHLRGDHVVAFMPGNFAALEFLYLLEGSRPDLLGRLLIGEAESLPYATRLQAPGKVWVKSIKERMGIGSLPGEDGERLISHLAPLFPQFYLVDNVLQTSLFNGATIVHPISTLLNLSRIEQMGPYRTGCYDVTPGVARAMEQADRERVHIAEALGERPRTLPEILSSYYRCDTTSLYEAMRSVTSFQVQTSPDGLSSRYITEDVPYGLVPVVELGRLAGVPTPTLDLFVRLAETVTGIPFRRHGRTLATMGLSGISTSRCRIRLQSLQEPRSYAL